MKKILFVSLWSLLLIGLIFVMNFAGNAHANRLCHKLEIEIEKIGEQKFITKEQILKFLSDHNKLPEGKEISQIDIPSIEQLILSHPSVESSEVFISVGGEMTIKIKQRRTIARIINQFDESYYLDDRGELMPWSEEYTSPVILVNGNFGESYAAMYHQSLNVFGIDSAIKTKTILDDVWQITKRIDADTFLKAQMIQLYVSPDKGFELIPRIGNHIIVLGDVSDLDEKFKKLLIFYRDGIDRTGSWNEYTYIDLQYKNQIVCTKNTTEHGI